MTLLYLKISHVSIFFFVGCLAFDFRAMIELFENEIGIKLFSWNKCLSKHSTVDSTVHRQTRLDIKSSKMINMKSSADTQALLLIKA